MSKIIEQLKNMPFVTGLISKSDKTGNTNKHIIIDVSKSLMQDKDSIPKLFKLLKSQSYFEWTVNMTD